MTICDVERAARAAGVSVRLEWENEYDDTGCIIMSYCVKAMIGKGVIGDEGEGWWRITHGDTAHDYETDPSGKYATRMVTRADCAEIQERLLSEMRDFLVGLGGVK